MSEAERLLWTSMLLSLDIWSEAVRSEVVWSVAACLEKCWARNRNVQSELGSLVWGYACPVWSDVLFEMVQSGMTCLVCPMLITLGWDV